LNIVDSTGRASGTLTVELDSATPADLIVREEDYYPERFRVREFPTRQQLEAIGLEEH